MIAKLLVMSCGLLALASCNKGGSGSDAGGGSGRAAAPCWGGGR